MQQMKWFERKFNFDYPPTLFPCILERVRGTSARLEELLHVMSPSILTRRVDGGWSIQEHAGHLFDLDELHDGRIDDYLASAPTLRPADLANRKTFEAHHNDKAIDKILGSFRTVRKKFVERCEHLDDEIITRSAIHPRLQQTMRLVDMLLFVAEHDDHHLARIVALAKHLSLGSRG